MSESTAPQPGEETTRVFGRRRSGAAPSIEARDFRGAPRPGPSEQKEIEALARRIGHALERGIGNYLRSPVRCESVAPDVLEYQEVVRTFSDKDWVVPLLADGGDRAVVRLDESFLNVMLTRVLGGGSLPKPAEGEIAEEEQFFEYETALSIDVGPISRSALKPVLRSMLREWNHLLRENKAPLGLDAAREALPPARQLRGADAVVAFDNEVWLGTEHGRVQILLQASSLADLVATGAPDRPAPLPVDAQERRGVESVVRGIDVDLRVVLGSAGIELKDYLKLQAGDVLVLDRKVGEPLEIRAGEKMEFTGQPGRVGGKLAVRILARKDLETTP
jgi:flagellar motor switch protein FliM